MNWFSSFRTDLANNEIKNTTNIGSKKTKGFQQDSQVQLRSLIHKWGEP
jgi:hypothetical protein